MYQKSNLRLISVGKILDATEKYIAFTINQGIMAYCFPAVTYDTTFRHRVIETYKNHNNINMF